MEMTTLILLAIGAAAGVLGVLALWLWQGWRIARTPWRKVFAVLPLPMLGVAASYGVYSFALLFVPAWVAVVQAAAFELTYIGLAVHLGLSEGQRQRARWISGGAVAVSILYNSLAGLFHRQPALLAQGEGWGVIVRDVLLSIAHGLPLALVAYFVADLLLHRSHDAAHLASLLRTPPASTPHDAPVPVALITDDAPLMPAPPAHACRKCGEPLASAAHVSASARWGCAACKPKPAPRTTPVAQEA